MNTSSEIKSRVVETGQAMFAKGLIAGTWGNISARVPDTSWIAATPSGRDYLTLVSDDIVIVDESGVTVEGRLKPTSELPLHMAIYKARPDIQAIVHTHSIFACSFAVAHKSIPPMMEDLAQIIGGGVDVAVYALPGTVDLAQNAVIALGKNNAVLLANHGLIGCGSSLTEAMTVCELVERSAQICINAHLIGGPHILSEFDVDNMHRFYVEHYRQRRGGAK